MGLTLKIQQQAVIRWCSKRQMFSVHIGVTIPYHGTLHECELYCHQRSLAVRNQDEVNRIKYQNMPTWEGLA